VSAVATPVVACDPDARDRESAGSVPTRTYFVLRPGASLYALRGEPVGRVAPPLTPGRAPVSRSAGGP
jgi:hypothetical protein